MARYVGMLGVTVRRLGKAAGVRSQTAVMRRNLGENDYVHDGEGT